MSTKRSRLLSLELDRIKNILIKKYNPDKIIAFGSFVQNKTHEDSDLDLAIIKKTKKSFMDRLEEVSLLIGPGLASDFVIYTPQEFESMKKSNLFVMQEIVNNGKTIYESKSL